MTQGTNRSADLDELEHATSMAEAHPEDAVPVDGLHAHPNEYVYAHNPENREGQRAICKERCGWERPLDELPMDDLGCRMIPPLCPECWKEDTISGVRTVGGGGQPEATDG